LISFQYAKNTDNGLYFDSFSQAIRYPPLPAITSLPTSLPGLLPPARDLVDHAAEDEAVEGEDGVPVEAAVNAKGAEGGGLGEAVLVVDFEFEPGFAG